MLKWMGGGQLRIGGPRAGLDAGEEVKYRPPLETRLKGARGMCMWVGRTTKGEDMGLE